MLPAAKVETVPTRALVTGCAGFIGSHVADRLLSSGWSVIGVDGFTDFYERRLKEANVAELLRDPRFGLVELDLAEEPLDGLLDGAEVVFHLAGQPGVRQSFGSGRLACQRNNVQVTERLLGAAARYPLRAFVYASSSSVYGTQERYPTAEDAPLRPISPYGVTKVQTERCARDAWQRHGVPVVGLRYFTVYGPRQRPDMAVSRFIAAALADQPLTINGDGRQVREFTFVDDVAQATIAAAERGKAGAIYNIGGGEQWRVLDVVECLGQLLDRRLDVSHVNAAVGDPPRTCADTTLARREFGFQAATPLIEGLGAQLEAALRHRRWTRRRTIAKVDV